MIGPLKQRNTDATRQRQVNMRKIYESMKVAPMLATEIACLLEFSPSGTRRYVNELHSAGYIEIAAMARSECSPIQSPIWKFTDNPALVEQFIIDTEVNSSIYMLRKGKAVVTEVPGHHLHILADDMPHPVRIPRIMPRRDPLVEALFGPAVA